MIPVTKKMMAMIRRTIPHPPVITFVKKRIAKTAAITILMIRSAHPMLFFIVTGFRSCK